MVKRGKGQPTEDTPTEEITPQPWCARAHRGQRPAAARQGPGRRAGFGAGAPQRARAWVGCLNERQEPHPHALSRSRALAPSSS